jgi:tetratricopeptide (TPR) repeat protein
MDQATSASEKNNFFSNWPDVEEKYFSIIIPVFILLLFTGVVFGLYSNTLESPFTFDDTVKIERNTHIRVTQFSLKEIVEAGLKSSKSRFIAYISFALNFYFHQYDLVGYHVVNNIVHVLSGFFLYLFLAATLRISSLSSRYHHPDLIAFLAALIWLIHPVQTQSVTYIMQRMTGMASMFFILSFWCYVKARMAGGDKVKWLWFAGSALVWLLSLGCKQITVTLPFFVFLYEWFFFQNLDKKWLKRKLPFVLGILVLLAFLALAYTDFHPLEKLNNIRDYKENQFTLTQRSLTQTRVVMHYVSLLVFPHPSRLNLDYDFPLSYSVINPFTTLLSLTVILGLIALGICLTKRERLISFCIFWFFGNLVIESSVLPLALIFEHRLYLPSMLFFLIPVSLGYRYIRLFWLRTGLLCLALVALSVWTYQRNQVWETEVSLWTDVVKKSPNKARPRLSLGYALSKQDRPDEAIAQYAKAIQLNPEYEQAHNGLGAVLEKQGRFDEAVQHYRRALQIFPKYVAAINNLGVALEKQGKIHEAMEHYRVALDLKPDHADVLNNMGNALLNEDKTDEAVEYLRKALELDPNSAIVHFNLGNAYSKQGHKNEAIGHYLTALQLNPDHAEAHNNLGTELLSQGRIDEASKHLTAALNLNPDLAHAHSSMGNLLEKQGKLNEALEHYRQALALDPDFDEAHNNLGLAMAKQGRSDEAVDHYHRALEINPDYAEAHNNLGGELLRQGRLDEARDHLAAALDLDPSLAHAHSNMGVVLLQKGKIDAAISHLREALRLQPDFNLAAENLQSALAIQKDLEERTKKIQADLEKDPNDPVPYFEMGNIYLARGEFNKAIIEFEKALDIEPRFAAAQYNLALAYAAGDQYDRALESFKKMLAIQPDNPNTYYNIAAMYALQNQVDDSVEWLKKAIAKGYQNWQLIKTDKDLENIRNSAAYKDLVKNR